MTPSNKTRLDELYGFWRTLRDAQYMRGMNYREKADMLRILREEFWPGYTYDEWCSSCVVDMVKALYTRYDKWLSEQPPPEPEPVNLHNIEPIPPINEEEIFNAHQVPKELFGVAATFPAHDKPEEDCSITTGEMTSIEILAPPPEPPKQPDPIFEQSEEVKKVVNKNHRRK